MNTKTRIDLTPPPDAVPDSVGMLINGNRVQTIDYRCWRDHTKARLALDYGKGTLELRFNEGYPPDSPCFEEQPEELAFYCTDTQGNVETWHAWYKARWWNNPKTDKRELFRPSFLCRVNLVPYDATERAWLEARENKRERRRKALEEEARLQVERQAQAQLDLTYKQAMIQLAGKTPQNTTPMKIGTTLWPMVRRGGFIVGQSPEGEQPKDPKEVERWQRGPKVWSLSQMVEFAGFRAWITATEQDNPKLFDGAKRGEQFTPDHVVEIVDVHHARFENAGILAVRIVVEPTANASLTIDETKQLAAVVDWLEGRTEPKGKRPTGKRKPGGKKHDLDGQDKWALESLIKNIAGGKRPKGAPKMKDAEVIRILLEKIKEHTTLKNATLRKRTLQWWVSRVRKGGTIPGSFAGRTL